MLSDKTIKGKDCKPRGKQFKKGDGKGLFLLIKPNGTKAWGMNYKRPCGRPNTLSFGTYPDVGLAAARAARDDARKLIAAGTDPADVRHETQRTNELTFGIVAEECFAKYAKKVSPLTASYMRERLDHYILPALHNRSISKIKTREVVVLLNEIEKTGKITTMHKVKSDISMVCCFAKAAGYGVEYDVTSGLNAALVRSKTINHAAVTDLDGVGKLMRACYSCPARISTLYAMRILPYVFLRSGEYRPGRWSEIDWDAKQWIVPKERMKMHRGDHIVPLARQVVGLLKELQSHTGDGIYMFPQSKGGGGKWLSNGTLNSALERMGYPYTVQTPHGFRTIFSTLMNNVGVNSDWIETQLSHKVGDETRQAYNQADYLEHRTALMQQYADYLDSLRLNVDIKTNVLRFPAARRSA